MDSMENTLTTKQYPIYCPIDLDCDLGRIKEEIETTRPFWLALSPNKNNVGKPRYFPVAPPEFYEDVDHFVSKEGSKVTMHQGKVSSWYGTSLRRVADRPETAAGSNRFRMKFDGWEWDDRMKIPYLRSVIEALPYERLEIVRVMSINVGGFGPTHVDWPNDDPWEKHGLASINFILDSGGSDMLIQHNGQIFPTKNAVFFFKDCVPHGIPPVTRTRIMMRVHGKAKPEFKNLLRLDEAVW